MSSTEVKTPPPDSPEFLDELPGEVEMSLFDHLEELRRRIFYSLINCRGCGCGGMFYLR
ncbi:hypothetical protein MiAbB_04161 [Microcystis aeruginosa NIES-4285]|uniref:Uncharacterized protein n=1 Tax=Microcystis aeruginosa NIES-4285 TaxID=2497681 RepID=A0A402DJ30_MICAE|nr:hypothetical protein MiAbB_04161 [Microcystis aeruginosa NIES-4285]